MIIEPASLACDVRSKNLNEGSFSACALWSFELFIGRFREAHPEPSGISANHAQGARALRLNPVPA
jgi:hypothetical protein